MKTAFTTLLSLLLVACVTTQQATLPRPGFGIDGVRPGDTVVIELTNGERHRFNVRFADAVGIQGWNESYAYTDMYSVEVIEEKYHGGSIFLTVLGIGLLLALSAMVPTFGFPATGPFCVYSSTDPHPDC